MERKTLVIKLCTLRQEFERDGISIAEAVAPVALILSDVCNVLGLSQAEHDFVLGKEVAEAIEEWESARLWLPKEEETATPPAKELAAVPAA
jgi:hypothetical protein